jgi:arsenical pump membrane protein
MLFTVVFVGSFVTAGVLNNDAAVVVNTTLVASLLRRRFAAQQDVAEPFLLAAFLGAGVAPLVISNPMNLTVSHLAGIDFLVYARFMVPVSLCGALVTFVVLAAIYRRVLTAVASPPTSSLVRSSRDARRGLFLLASALGGYAVCAMVHVPTWPVSLGAALLAFAWIVHSEGPRAGRTLLREDVAWHVLAVLPIVFVFAAGLTRSGAIDALVPVLRHAGALKIGLSSAVGSALLNNHTMALINVAALVPGAGVREVFAALIGGDLGPRFVPFGSLAGLLWLETLRQQGVHVGFGRFVQIGILTGLPTLLVCLMILRMLPG